MSDFDENTKLWDEYFADGDIVTKVLENKKYVDKVIGRPSINLKYEIVVIKHRISEINTKLEDQEVLEKFEANQLDNAVLRLIEIAQEYVENDKNIPTNTNINNWVSIYLSCKCDQLKSTWKLSEVRSKRINSYGLTAEFYIYLEQIHKSDKVSIFNDYYDACMKNLVQNMDWRCIPFRKIGGYDETDYKYDED